MFFYFRNGYRDGYALCTKLNKFYVSSFPRDNTVYPNGPVWIVISVGAVYAPPPPPLRGRYIKIPTYKGSVNCLGA